jgi:hypothetical protein
LNYTSKSSSNYSAKNTVQQESNPISQESTSIPEQLLSFFIFAFCMLFIFRFFLNE